MRLRLAVLALLFGATVTAAMADTLSCPDLSAAVQVGACPSEEELRYTFTGYCSDNARMYDKGADNCSDYQVYRRVKNVALWESADGAFHAYLSCDLPAAAVKEAKASGIAVARQGRLTRLVCSYREGITFTHRTKAQCKVEGDGNCAANPAACKASCE